jgi:hypothetical protein
MPLLAGGVADANERLVESKLVVWLRSATTSWRGSMNRLFLEWGGLDCCVLAKNDGGSGC